MKARLFLLAVVAAVLAFCGTALANVEYKVRKGDTLIGIAKPYGLDWQEIARANGIEDPRKLRAGATITIPGVDALLQRVRRGETLSGIAKQQYSDASQWKRIASANNISDPRQLAVGMTLVIPEIEAQTQVANVPEEPLVKEEGEKTQARWVINVFASDAQAYGRSEVTETASASEYIAANNNSPPEKTDSSRANPEEPSVEKPEEGSRWPDSFAARKIRQLRAWLCSLWKKEEQQQRIVRRIPPWPADEPKKLPEPRPEHAVVESKPFVREVTAKEITTAPPVRLVAKPVPAKKAPKPSVKKTPLPTKKVEIMGRVYEYIPQGPLWKYPGRDKFRGDLEWGLALLGYTHEGVGDLAGKIRAKKDFSWVVISYDRVFDEQGNEYKMLKMLSGRNKLKEGPDGIIPAWSDKQLAVAARLYRTGAGAVEELLLVPINCDNPTLVIRLPRPEEPSVQPEEGRIEEEAVTSVSAPPVLPEREFPVAVEEGKPMEPKEALWRWDWDLYASIGGGIGVGDASADSYFWSVEGALYPLGIDVSHGRHWLGAGGLYRGWTGDVPGFEFAGRLWGVGPAWKYIDWSGWDVHAKWVFGYLNQWGNTNDGLFENEREFFITGPSLGYNNYRRQLAGKKWFPETQVWGSFLFPISGGEVSSSFDGKSVPNDPEFEKFDGLLLVGARQFIYQGKYLRPWVGVDLFTEIPTNGSVNGWMGVSDPHKIVFVGIGGGKGFLNSGDAFLWNVGVDVVAGTRYGREQYRWHQMRKFVHFDSETGAFGFIDEGSTVHMDEQTGGFSLQ